MPQIGEPISAAIVTDPKARILAGGVVELSFQKPAKTSLEKTLVQPPHWTLGESHPGTTSKHPVAYPLSSANVVAKLKVKITESKNISGAGKLSGTLGPLTFHGDCPTGEGEHDVEAKIDELPDTLVWVRGDVAWTLEVESIGLSFALNSTRIELFTLIAGPQYPFPGHSLGVPVEALRWVFLRAGAGGMKTEEELVTAVTRACHRRPNTQYDTVEGGAHFLLGGNSYDLSGYVAPPTSRAVANCYDQAGAVYLLSRAFGVAVDIVYLGNSEAMPNEFFGYINTTSLIGVPGCNNPFYDSKGLVHVLPDPKNPPKKKLIMAFPRPLAPRQWGGDVDRLATEGARTSFGNHAFCSFRGNIYDACAGPATGSSKDDYVKAAIDSTTDYYDLSSLNAGTAAQIAPVLARRPSLLPKDWQ
jgi:hypothetical protein